jgi:hypothetical protein
MNEHINLDDSVLAPKRPLSMEPADTEGHLMRPSDDDSEGHIVGPSDDDSEGHIVRPSDDDTEGHLFR